MKVTDEDWAIVCEAIRGEHGLFFGIPLSKDLQTRIFHGTWAIQDGFYGLDISHWDWSGIRDSSHGAKVQMAEYVKQLLSEAKIQIPMDKVREKADESRKIRDELKNELGEDFFKLLEDPFADENSG